MKIQISDTAEEELSQLQNYIANTLSNPIAADNLIDKINDKIELLATFPYSGPAIPDEPAYSKGFRKFVVDNQLIIYSVIESEQIVRVHHILYAKSDFLSYL